MLSKSERLIVISWYAGFPRTNVNWPPSDPREKTAEVKLPQNTQTAAFSHDGRSGQMTSTSVMVTPSEVK